jgi:ketosteroid isomerase-like protein
MRDRLPYRAWFAWMIAAASRLGRGRRFLPVFEMPIRPSFGRRFRALLPLFSQSDLRGRIGGLMRPMCVLGVLLAVTCAPRPAWGQDIPLEHCDTLFVLQVSAASKPAWFLVDTAATSMLNLGSFKQGPTRDINVTSWSGTRKTNAKQITLTELEVGRTKLMALTLPAVDLSAIEKSCGRKIDGILGVELLGKIGATIDLKREVLHVTTMEEERDAKLISEMQRDTERCKKAFNDSSEDTFADCLDPKVALSTANEELYGREKVARYFREHYFHQTPAAQLDFQESAFHPMGDAVWYEYQFTIDSERGRVHGRGMAMCRKSDGHWRIASMHHAVVQSEPAGFPTASR